MKIVEARHCGVALAGRTSVRVVVEGTGFLRVGDARRFVFRRFDGFISCASADAIHVSVRGDKRELRAVVVDAPATVSVHVETPRVRAQSMKPRASVPAFAVEPRSFTVVLEGDR